MFDEHVGEDRGQLGRVAVAAAVVGEALYEISGVTVAFNWKCAVVAAAVENFIDGLRA